MVNRDGNSRTVSANAAHQIGVSEMQELLAHVVDGHLENVGRLLTANLALVEAAGSITDRSDRTFNGITAFQYAIWALDMEMCELILRYLPGPSGAMQLRSLESNPAHYSRHGAHYDLTPLIHKMQEYLDHPNWHKQEKEQGGEQPGRRYWCEEIGGEERQCPAWLVYLWCGKKEEPVGWSGQGIPPFKRQYQEGLINKWWHGEAHGGVLGKKWAASQGELQKPWICTPPEVSRLRWQKEYLESQVKPLRLEQLTRLHRRLFGEQLYGASAAPPTAARPTDVVAQRAQAVAPHVRVSDVEALLIYVVDGQLEHIHGLLQQNPALAEATGTVTDRSNRTFNNITAFQYAVWALDMETCAWIRKHLSQSAAAVQFQALEDCPNHYSLHGAHYDFTPLIDKTQEYLDHQSTKSIEQCEQHWYKVVGGAQRQCPAWLVYLWCEKGQDVAWTKDIRRCFKREYQMRHLEEWWQGPLGRLLGENCAYVRGGHTGVAMLQFNISGREEEAAIWMRSVPDDVARMRSLKIHIAEQLCSLHRNLFAAQQQSPADANTAANASGSSSSPSPSAPSSTRAGPVAVSVKLLVALFFLSSWDLSFEPAL